MDSNNTPQMPLLFSYGSLQREDVQLATFGRRLDGHRDELCGYEPSLVKIVDPELVARLGTKHHVNAIATGNPASRIPGTAFEVTDAELAHADEYEQADGYGRIAVALASGKKAWVYTHVLSREASGE